MTEDDVLKLMESHKKEDLSEEELAELISPVPSSKELEDSEAMPTLTRRQLSAFLLKAE